jgi:hypothetical protein
MVEAIGYGATVISTRSGAAGINTAACHEKLILTEDNDWAGFANAIINEADRKIQTPAAYYAYYNWCHITSNIMNKIEDISGNRG